MKRSAIVIFIFCLTGISNAYSQTYQSTWESIDSRSVPSWFEDARFGIFIHWGLYSVPAYSPTERDSVGIYDRYAEHYWRRWVNESGKQTFFRDFHNRVYGPNYTYQDFVSGFKAEMFNPDEWAKLFKESGAKYIVLTSKHHEGFTLWPSKLSWNWKPAYDLDKTTKEMIREIRLSIDCVKG